MFQEGLPQLSCVSEDSITTVDCFFTGPRSEMVRVSTELGVTQ